MIDENEPIDPLEVSGSDRFEETALLLSLPRLPIRVVLDNLRSAFNVGSIFRTSDAARVAHLHLCGITAHPPHRKIARTSLGATRYVPWSYRSNALDAVRQLRREGHQIVAMETARCARSYLDAAYRFPLALVLGHEVRGLSAELLAETDEVIAIPMRGVKNSINVATTFGVVLFEILRRYGDLSTSAE